MSRSADIHRRELPFCHPVVSDMPPSGAASFLAGRRSRRDDGHQAVLDSGCGEGRDSRFLLKQGMRVLSLDARERNLRVLSEMAAGEGVTPPCILADSVEGIPLASEAVDAVLDVWVLGSVILPHDGREGARRYLGEVHRILKPGGLFVTEFETPKPRRSPDELRTYLSGLLGRRFSIVTSEAATTDYASYVETPRRVDPTPALFAVASRE